MMDVCQKLTYINVNASWSHISNKYILHPLGQVNNHCFKLIWNKEHITKVDVEKAI